VTLDSSSNVALFTFPHDTVPPRPRAATSIDSISIRLEFSQALNPTASLDTSHVHVLALPDSTPVPIDKILTQRLFDSLATAARQKAESAAAAARDTTRRPPPPPPPPPQAAPTQPARGAALRAQARPSVDTALVRRLLAQRPIPSDRLVITLVHALKPEARYVVRVTAATNLIGKKGDGDVGFTVPKPAAPDSTRRTPSRPPRPPQPPPTSKPPS